MARLVYTPRVELKGGISDIGESSKVGKNGDNGSYQNDDIADGKGINEEGMKDDFKEFQKKNTATNEEMQYDDREDIVPLPESHEPKTIKTNPEENVSLSQIETEMVETEKNDTDKKQSLMSTGITDAAKGLSADAPSATATKSEELLKAANSDGGSNGDDNGRDDEDSDKGKK